LIHAGSARAGAHDRDGSERPRRGAFALEYGQRDRWDRDPRSTDSLEQIANATTKVALLWVRSGTPSERSGRTFGALWGDLGRDLQKGRGVADREVLVLGSVDGRTVRTDLSLEAPPAVAVQRAGWRAVGGCYASLRGAPCFCTAEPVESGLRAAVIEDSIGVGPSLRAGRGSRRRRRRPHRRRRVRARRARSHRGAW